MSNIDILPDVVSSLIQKVALLEKKNAQLEQKLAKSKENEEKLESEVELQQYIIDELNDDVKAKDAEIAIRKKKILSSAERIAGPAYFDLRCTIKFSPRLMSNLEKHHIEEYRKIHSNRLPFYSRSDIIRINGYISDLYNYLDARQ